MNSKIYTIKSPNTPAVYIGSTIEKLSARMSKHRASYKAYTRGRASYLSAYVILGAGDAYIELLEDFPCICREALNNREGYFITTMDCVNTNIAGRDRNQYYLDNKQQILEYGAQYRVDNKEDLKKKDAIRYLANRESRIEKAKEQYQKNKDVIKLKGKERVTCECGIQHSRAGTRQHLNTQRHNQNILRMALA